MLKKILFLGIVVVGVLALAYLIIFLIGAFSPVPPLPQPD